MKRQREPGSDDEPLTKRINDLHLDAKLSGNSAIGNELSNGASTSHPLENGFGPEIDPNGSNCQQHNVETALCNLSDSTLEEMIARREIPESLQLCYPAVNPTSNNVYFEANRQLHELHIERLKRLGKLYINK
ncbi:uncharacterized protein LOC143036450 [Oratosquilla oratoria]|uniref:uncharacterized protein LOC143036450 n=1 Tax=Oratosquilla oratoria TaxID=337810 RepID=UPI003F76DDED